MQVSQIPVTDLKGVGLSLAEKLNSLHIYTVLDLLEHFPSRYNNYEVSPIEYAKHDEKITILGTVATPAVNAFYGKNRSRMTFTLDSGGHTIKAVLFNRPFLKNKLTAGTPITATGKWDLNRKTLVVATVKTGHHEASGIAPHYTANQVVANKTLSNLIKVAFDTYHLRINDDLPPLLTTKYRLISYQDAIKFVHFPENNEQLKQAHRRIKYEELLKFQLKLQLMKRKIKHTDVSFKKERHADKIEKFLQHLPFELTNEQKRVLNEIEADLTDPSRMNRLLQGDVGSGKTVIAALALLMVIADGYQGTIMAPTEILAKQHLETLTELFAPFPEYRIEFLSSNIKGKKRKEILSDLSAGTIHLLIGTHSLIQDEVVFSNLGLAVIDEQHRFGVAQRQKLRQKGTHLDLLMMSATPIPRTLAISAFGDMDISAIRELPMGRKPIKTYLIDDSKLKDMQAFIQTNILDKGQQLYIVTPLIDESEALEDVRNATLVYEQWKAVFKGRANVALMHGKLHQNEKDEIMTDFVQNKVQILISTTVIEVGVNVPNANLILIYDANRFGLSQLHQLRGRVGRGDQSAYCILLSNAKNKEAKERLSVIVNSTDGFEIAEADLKLRGPGDFFGVKQSGLPTFKLANLIEDYNILEVARQDAYDLTRGDEFDHNPEFQALREFAEATILSEEIQLD